MNRGTTILLILVLVVCTTIGVNVQNLPLPDNDIVVSLVRPIDDVEVIKQAMKSVVKVVVEGGGHGSGFYVGYGIVVTAGHCVDKSIKKVIFENGKEYTILRQERNLYYDCGFVIIESVSQPALRFNLDELKRGEEIFVFGNPHNLEFIVTKGIVGGFGRLELFGPIDLVIIDASPHAGHSGSVLLDSDGKIRGLWVGGKVSRCGAFLPGLGCAVRVEDILCAMAQIKLEY